jgi:serine/threonine protein kinase
LLDIDVKCPSCGRPQTSTGAYRMVGNVVLGQYEIVDILGQGGMSVVYKGRHKLTEQEVALKLLPPEMAAMAQVKSRFVEEARALAQLDHPNIVHLYNFGEENGCFVLAMQYVHGQTFERMILDAATLDWQIACRISIDVLRALEYAHGRGIIHRDMKPSNILVRELDGSATVMDFGIAKMTSGTSRLTATGQTMGTVRYMSPEQVRGLSVDARTDIYSLGASLYEAVCGDTPFDGSTHFEIMTKHLQEAPPAPRDLGVELPAALEGALLKTLAKDPDGRFEDARAFRKELERILREHDVGWAETMRLTRDSLALDSLQPNRATAAPASPAARQSAKVIASPDAHAAASISPHAPTAALDLVGVETIESISPAGSGREMAAPAKAATTDRASGRPAPWIALAGAAVLIAAGAVFYVTRADSSAARPQPAAHDDTAVADAVPRWPPAFVPPGNSFAVDRIFEDHEVRVLAPEGWDPAAVLRAHREGHALFADMLARRKLADDVTPQPLSIAIVPARLFCDARVYEHGRVPQSCADKEVHYRPGERTLFVVDSREHLGVNVAYGNAIAVCLHSKIPGCDDVAQDIDSEFAERPQGDK